MSDLISRQAAIDAIDEYIEKNRRPDFIGNMVWVSGVADAMRIVSDLPSVQEQRWIPVTERLPEKNGRYFVTRGLHAIGDIWRRVYIVNYSDLMGLKAKRIFWIGNVGKSDFERIDDVIAWMPLPEPYKERTDENH